MSSMGRITLLTREITFRLSQSMLSQSTNVDQTDGRTDRRHSHSNTALRTYVLRAVKTTSLERLYRLSSNTGTWWPKMAQSMLRCGGIFSDNVITNFLLILTVKEF